MEANTNSNSRSFPWNKDKLVGQKPPLKLKEVWAIRMRLQLAKHHRDLALFNLAIDSKLRGCDLVSLTVNDIATVTGVKSRAGVRQRKTGRPVQFEITEQTREALTRWIERAALGPNNYLFPSKIKATRHITTRQYSRLTTRWIDLIGLNPDGYGTHSLRRTKVSLIYKRTGNIRAVQLLLGHTKLESTVRYLGIEIDDALSIAEKMDV
ncbi:MAG: tyrosine-type recombinase/integrase [Proteobacteria bacterium]|nr:tyrosine-type recombinase/integrase [Pseudomonadota bacterium]